MDPAHTEEGRVPTRTPIARTVESTLHPEAWSCGDSCLAQSLGHGRDDLAQLGDRDRILASAIEAHIGQAVADQQEVPRLLRAHRWIAPPRPNIQPLSLGL